MARDINEELMTQERLPVKKEKGKQKISQTKRPLFGVSADLPNLPRYEIYVKNDLNLSQLRFPRTCREELIIKRT